MSAYQLIDCFAPPISATVTVPQFELGYQMRAQDFATGSSRLGVGEFIYCQGSNVDSVGRWIRISNNSAVLVGTVNSTAPGPLGIAAGALSATNVFGWVQVQGVCDYVLGTNSSIPAGNSLFLAAGTAGVAVSNPVAGNRIIGAVLGASYTSSQSKSQTVFLNYPQIVGVTAGY